MRNIPIDRWAPAGRCHAAHTEHFACALRDGRVLTAGGAHAATRAMLWEPSKLSFRATASMQAARRRAAAAVLDDGRVLVVGGASGDAELFDPERETWKPIAPPRADLSGATATLLADGHVLSIAAEAWMWDPRADRWHTAGRLRGPRGEHHAVRLDDGRVMVLIDSGDETSVELWDPESLRFSRASAPEIHTRNFTATALSDGRVLVSGGQNLGGHEEARAEIWDDGEWTRTGELATPRAGHRAVLLSRDRVLITGGKNTRVGLVAASEIWEPSTGRFIRAGTMLAGRSGHAVVSLGRDRVLAIGGTMIEAEDELGAELFGDWPEGQDDARL